jgi:hypothetical protein
MSSDYIYSTTTSTKSSTIFSMKSHLITTAAKDQRLKQFAAFKMLTLLVFEFYNTKTTKCNPSDHLLMKKLRLCERTVRNCRTRLIELGYISVGTNNNYTIHWTVPAMQFRQCSSKIRQCSAAPPAMQFQNPAMQFQTENEYPSDSIQQSADFQPGTIEEPLNLTIERTHQECVVSDSDSMKEEPDEHLFAALADYEYPAEYTNSRIHESANLQTNINPSANDDFLRPYIREFELFWQHYPTKVGDEAEVYRAFVAAVRNNNGDVASIVNATPLFTNFCARQYRKQEDWRYIPAPISWLRKKGWKDTARLFDPHHGSCNSRTVPLIEPTTKPTNTDELSAMDKFNKYVDEELTLDKIFGG